MELSHPMVTAKAKNNAKNVLLVFFMCFSFSSYSRVAAFTL
jgi:hypothetical protein